MNLSHPARDQHKYEARIHWTRNDDAFTDNHYRRAHQWSFDGGTVVTASSSPQLMPEPYSLAAAVDPEEALVAPAASCHMLCFLALAATQGFVVDDYEDEAFGVMEKNGEGRLAITRITLRPRIRFCEETPPSASELESLHHAAHETCFIANSLKSEIVVVAR